MLAFTALSGPPTVRLLGNTPIGFSGILGSLGADVDQNAGDGSQCPTEEPVWNDYYGSCVVACPTGQTYDSNGVCVGGGKAPSTPSGGSSGHWYDFLSPLATGVTKGLVTQTPSGPIVIAPIEPPWYTQWWGMAAIGVGILGAGSMLLGKPKSSPAAAVAGLFGIGKRRRRRR